MQNAPGIGKGTPFMQKIGGADGPTPPPVRRKWNTAHDKWNLLHVKWNEA